MAEGPLFIVDNSEGGRNGLDYLREWSELASSIDIATPRRRPQHAETTTTPSR